MTSRHTLVAAGLALLIGLISWFAFLREPGSMSAAGGGAESSQRNESGDEHSGAADPPIEVSNPSPNSGRDEAGTDSPERTPDTSPDEENDPRFAHITGRLLLPGGAPATGVVLKLRGSTATSDRARKYGIPDNWKDITGTTDQDGRFDLAFDPPRAFQFTLTATYPGYAALSWSWSSLPQEETTDVGERTFAVTGAIVGRVRRPDGRTAGGTWTVYGEPSSRGSGVGTDAASVHARANEETGAFRLDGLPPGTATVEAYSNEASWIGGGTVDVVALETVEHDVIYDGPEIGSRITVRTFCQKFSAFSKPVNGSIVARDADGREYVAERIEGTTQTYAINDLPEGSYTIEVTSEVHEPWSRSEVEPGTSVRASLTGSTAVALVVTDAATGDGIDAYSLGLQFDDARSRSRRFDLHKAKDPLPPGGLFTGLIPRESTLIIEAEGYSAAEASLGALEPGESREVAVELTRGAEISVQVVHANGTPATGTRVLIHPTWPLYDPTDFFSGPSNGSEKSAFESKTVEGESDAEGRLVASGIPAMTYDAQARIGLASARVDGLEAVEGETIHARIELPPLGTLVGTVRWKGGAAFDGLRALVYPKGGTKSAHTGRSHRIESSAVDELGMFTIEGIPAGTHVVELYQPAFSLPFGPSGSTRTNPKYIAIGEVEIIGDEEVRRTFDAAEHTPGGITVSATVNGNPATGAVVEATYADATSETGGVIGVDGVLELEQVFPGSVTLSIRHANFAWSVKADEPIEIEPGARIAHSFRVETARGKLRILNAATGEPAKSQRIAMGFNQFAETDADGWLDVELQVGTRYFAAPERWDEFMPDEPGQVGVAVEWGPDGPVVESIRVEFE